MEHTVTHQEVLSVNYVRAHTRLRQISKYILIILECFPIATVTIAHFYRFTQSCHLGPRGQPICDCPTGYRGETCNECDTGYTGNPLQPGDYCKPVVDTCDTRGSLSQERDAYGQCHCKVCSNHYSKYKFAHDDEILTKKII